MVMKAGSAPHQDHMQIRPFHPADLDHIHAINQNAVPLVGTTTQQELFAIANQACIALVAHPPGDVHDPVGFCLVLAPTADYASENFAWFRERYDDFIYLDRVAIVEKYKRQGLGRSLYNKVEASASECTPWAKRLTLEVNIEPRNEASLAFHEQLGFAIVGERDTRYGTRVALMQKPLEGA